MDFKYSRNIITANNLIPRKLSKKVISYINLEKNYQNYLDIKFSKYLTIEKLNKLRSSFQKFKNKNKKKIFPRNYLIYKYINMINPKVTINLNNKSLKFIPELDGIRLSLSTLLLKNDVIQKNNLHSKIFIVSKLKELFIKSNFIKPHDDCIKNFYSMIENAKKNDQKITIVTPACPDYSTTKEGNMYRFTFNSIGNEIGLVAKRLKKDIHEIHKFFYEHKIKFQHIISIGDFEAFSKKNQKRLVLNEKKYLEKLRLNQKIISEEFKIKNCITNKLFTNIFGNKKTWSSQKTKYKNKISNSNFGKSNLDIKKFNENLIARLPLYKRWYGELSLSEYKKIFIDQAAEYSSMGFLIKKKYKNSIILGADHFKMSQFYRIDTNIPVFYLSKNYIT